MTDRPFLCRDGECGRDILKSDTIREQCNHMQRLYDERKRDREDLLAWRVLAGIGWLIAAGGIWLW